MIAQTSISSPPAEQRSYYVYTLARPDGSVFYVGKGSGKRIHHHERLTRSDPNKEKCEVIRQILALDEARQRFLDQDDDRIAAEVAMIAVSRLERR